MFRGGDVFAYLQIGYNDMMTSTAKSTGFSMIELLIGLVVLAIIATVATGVYTSFSLKSRRADGVNAILTLQLAEERYRSTHTQYGTLAQISGSSSSPAGYYTLTISNVGTNTVTITATGQGKQAGDTDGSTACSPLVLAISNGNVTQTPAACWPS